MPIDCPGIELLFVCTANQCRSAMAALLMRHRLAGRAADVSIGSAGLLPGGRPVTPETMDVMDDWGLDASAHRSRQLTAELVAGADLVLGMERRHVAEAAVLVPEAWPRCFTLKEIVRRGEHIGPRRPGESMAQWLAAVHAGRATADLVGASDADDIADPVVSARVGFKQTAAEIDDLLGRLVRLAWPGEGGQG